MNTYNSGLEAFLQIDQDKIVNLFRRSRVVTKKMPKNDNIKTYVNENTLKQMVNILSAFLPSDNKYIDFAKKSANMSNEELKREFNTSVIKSYRFVTGRDPKNFRADIKNASFKDSISLIASDIKLDLLNVYKSCEKATYTITKERALEILIFFEHEILPKLERLYEKVLLHNARNIGITIPEVLSRISWKTKKQRKLLEDKLKRENINIDSIKSFSSYESFTDVLTTSIDEFISITRLDLIWEIFDKIINEIDSWR